MFGLGAGELIIILIVALLALGPEKLPDAAKKIGQGIRDLKRQTRELQHTIENDTQVGDAVREIKAALRGDELTGARPPVRRTPPIPPASTDPATPPPVPTVRPPLRPAPVPAGAPVPPTPDADVQPDAPAAEAEPAAAAEPGAGPRGGSDTSAHG